MVLHGENILESQIFEDLKGREGRVPGREAHTFDRMCFLEFLPWLMTNIHEVRSLASLSGLRIQCCRELWRRSQTQLESVVAVAQVRGYKSN